MNAKDVLGKQGEELAADFLARAGLEILERNWRCPVGEIDIVAADGRVLAVCEVKTRSGVGFGTPLESVTQRKARRLRLLAVRWVQASGVMYDEIRIDVIAVLRSPEGDFSIDHIRGVA